MRVDSAYYAIELLERLRRERARFTVSVPRSQAMWTALDRIAESAWSDALDMAGAQVAETVYRPGGWKHEPLRLIVRRVPFTAERIARAERLPPAQDDPSRAAADGLRRAARLGLRLQLHPDRHPAPAHRLGRALPPPPRADRRAPEGHQDRPGAAPPPLRRHQRQPRLADRAMLALNLTAWCCDLSPAAAASGHAPDTRTPLRRHAHTLRRTPVQRPRPDHPHRPTDHPQAHERISGPFWVGWIV